jgi:hypothetical protein
VDWTASVAQIKEELDKLESMVKAVAHLDKVFMHHHLDPGVQEDARELLSDIGKYREIIDRNEYAFVHEFPLKERLLLHGIALRGESETVSKDVLTAAAVIRDYEAMIGATGDVYDDRLGAVING